MTRRMSSSQVAGPPWKGVSIRGLRTCQISFRYALVRDRAVGAQPVRLFIEAVAIDDEKDVLVPGRGATMEGRVDQRLENVPDFLSVRSRPGPGCRRSASASLH